MKTRAFSYVRVSGKGQISGGGFPRQRASIERYAKAHRVEIITEFRDEGVSGTKDAFDRAGLTDLFVAIKSNGVRLVLVERPDRLARDLMVGEILLAEFRKLKVKLVSAECGTELTVEDNDPTRKLIRQVLGAISEWEKTVLVQKLRAARLRIRRSKGRCEGRKPYGSTPDEQAVVARIVQWRDQGWGVERIADQLNFERVCTRTGAQTRWHPTQVRRVLSRAKSISLSRSH